MIVPNAPLRAAVYVRVSTSEQAERGSSLATQTDACRAHALSTGYVVPDGLVFVEDGWSGATLDRPMLDDVRRLADAGEIAAVVAYSTDRLSRDPIQLGVLVQEFDKRRVALELVTEPLDGSPEGQLLTFVRGWAAQLERAKISERTSRGKRDAARQGKLPTGTTLYGYRYTRATKDTPALVEIDAEQAETVRTVFRWYVEDGIPQRGITIKLNDLGIPAPSHGHGDKRKGGAAWHMSAIQRMLTNPAYAGKAEAFRWKCVEPIKPDPDRRRRQAKSRHELRPADERIAIHDAIPALVSEELWQAAQTVRERNRATASRNTRRAYLLAGRVVCAWCRRRYTATTNRDTWTYYYCSASKSEVRSQRCRNARLAGAALEADVWTRVEAALSDPSVITAELERRRQAAGAGNTVQDDLGRVEASLGRLKGQQERIVRLYRFGEIDDDYVTAEMAKVTAERERWEGERDRLLARVAADAQAITHLEGVAPYLERVRRKFGALDHAGRRLALEALGVVVTVDGDAYRVEASIPIGEPESVAIATRRWSGWRAHSGRCRPRPGPARPGAPPPRTSTPSPAPRTSPDLGPSGYSLENKVRRSADRYAKARASGPDSRRGPRTLPRA